MNHIKYVVTAMYNDIYRNSRFDPYSPSLIMTTSHLFENFNPLMDETLIMYTKEHN